MFGVTTSDDYRPVAWMGRYPVDVTTMLVGLHVALAVIACILVAASGGFPPQRPPIRQHRSAKSWTSLADIYLRFCSFSIGPSFVSRSRCTCFLFFGREVERFLGQRAYIYLYSILLLGAGAGADDLGPMATSRAGRLAGVAFRNLCGVSRPFIRALKCFSGLWRNGSP